MCSCRPLIALDRPRRGLLMEGRMELRRAVLSAGVRVVLAGSASVMVDGAPFSRCRPYIYVCLSFPETRQNAHYQHGTAARHTQ